MNNSDSINANWQQNERTASDERERSLCPPHEDTGDEQGQDERDYAEFRVMVGKSWMLADKAYLFGMKGFYEKIIKEINEKAAEAIMEMKEVKK